MFLTFNGHGSCAVDHFASNILGDFREEATPRSVVPGPTYDFFAGGCAAEVVLRLTSCFRARFRGSRHCGDAAWVDC